MFIFVMAWSWFIATSWSRETLVASVLQKLRRYRFRWIVTEFLSTFTLLFQKYFWILRFGFHQKLNCKADKNPPTFEKRKRKTTEFWKTISKTFQKVLRRNQKREKYYAEKWKQKIFWTLNIIEMTQKVKPITNFITSEARFFYV